MKRTAFFPILLCLFFLIFAAGTQAHSAGVACQIEKTSKSAVFAQLTQDEAREDTYQTEHDQPLPDSGQVEEDHQPLSDSDSEDEDHPEQPGSDYSSPDSDDAVEDYPGMESNDIPGDETEKEPYFQEKDYPSPDSGGADEEHPTDVQSPNSAATQATVGSAPGTTSQQATPPKCNQATGHSIFRLTSAGVNSGASYFQPGARVEFWNDSSVTHDIVIEPAGILSNNSFSITPGSKVLMFASSPGQVTGGSIVANPGGGQTVHDIVVCP